MPRCSGSGSPQGTNSRRPFCLLRDGRRRGRRLRLFPIRAARWIAPGADKARLLSEKPSECLAKAQTPELAYQVEIGRAAFNTPLLLGGQASRAGLQCESCHRGGRTNPQFFFPHVSGKPGTADVTTSVFSSHRGDGIDNPKPIPDLSGPRALLKVSRDPKKPDLRNFIHGLVTQEFDGAEPPPAVMDGLAAYVRSLTPEACPPVRSRADPPGRASWPTPPAPCARDRRRSPARTGPAPC